MEVAGGSPKPSPSRRGGWAGLGEPRRGGRKWGRQGFLPGLAGQARRADVLGTDARPVWPPARRTATGRPPGPTLPGPTPPGPTPPSPTPPSPTPAAAGRYGETEAQTGPGRPRAGRGRVLSPEGAGQQGPSWPAHRGPVPAASGAQGSRPHSHQPSQAPGQRPQVPGEPLSAEAGGRAGRGRAEGSGASCPPAAPALSPRVPSPFPLRWGSCPLASRCTPGGCQRRHCPALVPVSSPVSLRETG